MKWNLRLAAASRGIWKASELQRLLAEGGMVISAGKMSGLWSGRPNTVRLDELEVICAVLGCDIGELLHDDTTAAIQTWIDRRTGELPAGFGRDIRAWLVVLREGDARTRPRSHATLRVHFGIVRCSTIEIAPPVLWPQQFSRPRRWRCCKVRARQGRWPGRGRSRDHRIPSGLALEKWRQSCSHRSCIVRRRGV